MISNPLIRGMMYSCFFHRSYLSRETERITCSSNGKRFYYLFDGLGSIVGLTDSTGSEVNAYDYDPYGNMLNQKEGVSNPWKFAGGYSDSSTSLYKFGVRYYDPTLGRWTQQDPVGGSLGDLNSVNRYVYANDDPVNATDPAGNCAGAQASMLNSQGTGIVFLNECVVQVMEGLLWVGVGFAIIGAVIAAIVGTLFSTNPGGGLAATIPFDIAGGALTVGAGGLQAVDGSGGNQGIIVTFYNGQFQGIAPQ